MTTYTIALLGDVLYGVAPDGADIMADVARVLDAGGIDPEEFPWDDLKVIRGCTLVDDIEAGDEVIYAGNQCGFLTDEEGRRWHAAVLREAV
jgi:hypothetical protein